MKISFNLDALRQPEILLNQKSWGVYLLLFVFLFVSCKKDHERDDSRNCNEFKKEKKYENGKNEEPTVTVFATGFNNPRGLKFGPDCYLYVAEAGLGGTRNTAEMCPEIQPPAEAGAPFLGSPTGGRISKVNAKGERSTVTDRLPTTISTGGDILGAADVAFIGNNLYALLWAGCSHGVPEFPNGIVRINSNGTHTVIADIGAWQVTHPAANTAADFEPEGNPFTMIVVNNDFYVVEANQGQLLKATLGGNVSRVVDLSASQGHLVPTVTDFYQGNFYLGNLGVYPTVQGSSKIYRITPQGQVSVAAEGFTTILGLVIDKKGRMYVLENTIGNPFPTPGTGRIVRVNTNGSRDIIATGFSLATAMTYGPDGNLYVSNWGFGAGAGEGQVLKVRLDD